MLRSQTRKEAIRDILISDTIFNLCNPLGLVIMFYTTYRRENNLIEEITVPFRLRTSVCVCVERLKPLSWRLI